MTGPVDWQIAIFVVGTMLTSIMVSGGVLWAVFNWVYRDNNAMRDRITDLAKEVSRTFVSVETHRLTVTMIEKSIEGIRSSIDELKADNRAALDRLSETVNALTTALTPPKT